MVPRFVHLPGLRGAFRDHVEHQLCVEPGAHGQVQPLGQPLHQAGNADLVDHLGKLARAGRAEQGDGAGIGVDNALATIEYRGLSAHHDREHTVDRARFAAGYRRVHEAEAALRRVCRQLLRDAGRRGSVIDENGAGAHPLEGTAGADRHRAHVVVVADAGEDDLVADGRFGGGGGGFSGKFAGPPRGFRRRPVVDGHVMAGFRQMSGHVVAHDPEAEEGDLPRFVVR